MKGPMLPQVFHGTDKRQVLSEGIHSKAGNLHNSRSGTLRALAANPSVIILLAPVVFWVHVIEERAEGFMRWYNSVVPVPLPESGFVSRNLQPLVILVVLAVAAAWIRRKEPAFLLLLWLSYFMFANAIFHVTATVALHRYCPGLITALALYLPYYFWYTRYLRTTLSMHPVTIAVVSALAISVVYLHWHAELFGN
jgi:Protein of unknown function with HXXEE motif